MQVLKNPLLINAYRKFYYLLPFFIFLIFTFTVLGQVNTVEFGKNRVQFKKFKWAYYQTDNFNSYYSQDGEPLAKYVAQVAER